MFSIDKIDEQRPSPSPYRVQPLRFPTFPYGETRAESLSFLNRVYTYFASVFDIRVSLEVSLLAGVCRVGMIFQKHKNHDGAC